MEPSRNNFHSATGFYNRPSFSIVQIKQKISYLFVSTVYGRLKIENVSHFIS